MNKYPWIRTVYLYLFSMLGLVLLVIGAVQFFNLGLKAWVFTEAESQERAWSIEKPFYEKDLAEAAESEDESGEICLTEGEKEELGAWLKDHNERQEELGDYDPVTSNRHRTAAMAFALILVGIPLFLFHWLIIRKENKA